MACGPDRDHRAADPSGVAAAVPAGPRADGSSARSGVVTSDDRRDARVEGYSELFWVPVASAVGTSSTRGGAGATGGGVVLRARSATTAPAAATPPIAPRTTTARSRERPFVRERPLARENGAWATAVAPLWAARRRRAESRPRAASSRTGAGPRGDDTQGGRRDGGGLRHQQISDRRSRPRRGIADQPARSLSSPEQGRMARWWREHTTEDSDRDPAHEPRRHRRRSVRQPRPEDRGELHRPRERLEGLQPAERVRRRLRSLLRRVDLPPRHRRLHGPGRRPDRHRHRRPRLPVRRRVPPRAAVRSAVSAGHGERRPRHQRLTVLHHGDQDAAPEPQAHHLRVVADDASRKVVDEIATTSTDRRDKPLDDVVIEKIEIS